MSNHKFSRRELYELLWSKSVAKVASELNIKDSQIRKVCQHFQIPLPKSGYWSKIRHGKPVSIDELKPAEEWDCIQIDLEEALVSPKEHYLTKLSRKTLEISNQFPKESKVSDRLSSPDALILAARADLSKRTSHSLGGFPETICTYQDHLDIEVTKSNVGRALRFYDAFIKIMRLRGHIIWVESHGTYIKISGQKYQIKLREKGNRIKDENSTYPSTMIKPNGKLSIKLMESYRSKEWSDGNKTIKEQLPKIVAALELKAEKDIAKQIEIDEYWIEYRRLEAIEEEKKARARWKKQKIEILIEHSKQWHEVEILNSFISHIESMQDSSESQKEWIEWAKHVAENRNPLSKGLHGLIEPYEFKNAPTSQKI